MSTPVLNGRSAFAPTVLLVDDDFNITRRWTKEFYKRTSLGVLVANSIPEGIRLAMDQSLKVDAVITDIFFESKKQDEQRSLSNGIDFLKYLGEQNIEVPMFVVSASSEMLDYKERAKTDKIPIVEYYDKLNAASAERPAWVDIQRWVLTKTFGPDSDITKSLAKTNSKSDAIDVINETLCRLQLPIRTYIQDLGDNTAKVIRPIEVICVARGSSSVDAYATTLGLPAHGHGEDITTAVEDLQALISTEAETLLHEDSAKLSEYASKVMRRLSQYIIFAKSD